MSVQIAEFESTLKKFDEFLKNERTDSLLISQNSNLCLKKIVKEILGAEGLPSSPIKDSIINCKIKSISCEFHKFFEEINIKGSNNLIAISKNELEKISRLARSILLNKNEENQKEEDEKQFAEKGFVEISNPHAVNLKFQYLKETSKLNNKKIYLPLLNNAPLILGAVGANQLEDGQVVRFSDSLIIGIDKIDAKWVRVQESDNESQQKIAGELNNATSLLTDLNKLTAKFFASKEYYIDTDSHLSGATRIYSYLPRHLTIDQAKEKIKASRLKERYPTAHFSQAAFNQHGVVVLGWRKNPNPKNSLDTTELLFFWSKPNEEKLSRQDGEYRSFLGQGSSIKSDEIAFYFGNNVLGKNIQIDPNAYTINGLAAAAIDLRVVSL